MFFLFLAALLIGARAEDACAAILGKAEIHSQTQAGRYSGVLLRTDDDVSNAFACLQSATELPNADANDLLAEVTRYSELYAFIDDLKNPPAAIREEGVDSAIDIPARLASVPTDSGAFAFHMELMDIFAHARDAHTGYTVPCYSNGFYFHNLVSFCPKLEGGTLTIRTCAEQSSTLAALNISVPGDTRVRTINGVDALAFLEDFADNHMLIGRDRSQRFELLLAQQYRLGVRDLLAVEAGALLLDRLAFRELALEFYDDSTVTVPIAFMILNGAMTYKDYCEMSASYVSSLSTSADGLLSPLPDQKERSNSALRHSAFQTAVPYRLMELDSARVQTKNSQGWIQTHLYDEQCVISSTTFHPGEPEDYSRWFPLWLKELEDASLWARENECGVSTGLNNGVPQGKRIVFDLRVNPGGYFNLLDIFTNMFFPSYTPHHLTVATKRLSASESDLVDALAKLEGPNSMSAVRAPYSFVPDPNCNGYMIGCTGWKKEPIMRGDQAYAKPYHTGPLFWETPNYTTSTEYQRWAGLSSVRKRYGTDADTMAESRKMRLKLGDYEPDPELTLFLFGYNSASTAGAVAMRARSFGLGAIVRQGYAGHHPKQAAMVAGANVIDTSSLANSGLASQLPYGANLMFTTRATLAYTHDTSPTDETLPLEFVALPPHAVFQHWEPHATMYTEEQLSSAMAELAVQVPVGRCVPGLYAAAHSDCDATSFPHADRVGRACDEATGAYTGTCGIARCSFGYELRGGECVDVGFVLPPRLKSAGLPAWGIALIVIACVAAVIVAVVVVVCIIRKR